MIRVVVVDDHPIVRAGIVGLLEGASEVEVVGQAADGREALAVVGSTPTDLVLTDLRMPGMDGVELTAALAAGHPQMKVLVLTTYETDAAVVGAIEAGADGYLLKAAPQAEILAGIHAVMRGQTALSPSVALAMVTSMRSETPPVLSGRETEVLRLVAEGQTNAAIGRHLFVSEATVKTYLQRIFSKLDVCDRTRAVTRAQELGLLGDRDSWG